MNKFLSLTLVVFTLTGCSAAKEDGKSAVEKQLEEIGLQNVVEKTDLEDVLFETGEINRRELLNRQLLREIMTEAGWLVEPSEWWHFNAMPLSEASQSLTVIQ